MRKKPPTDKEQQIVAEILTAFMFVNDMEQMHKVWNDIYKRFALCDDPFTGCPCSSKEAIENQREKERQIMMERYGHYDGLE